MSLAIKYSREYDDYLSFKRKVNFLCILALVIAFVFFVGMPTSYAGKINDFFKDQSIEGIVDIICFSFTAPMYVIVGLLIGVNYGKLCQGYRGKAAQDAGTIGLHNFFQAVTGKEESNYSLMSATFFTETMKNFMNVLKGVAAFLILIIAAARIFSNMEKGMEGTQAVMKFLMEIGIVGVFIIYTDKIMATLCGVGVQLCKKLTNISNLDVTNSNPYTLAKGVAVMLCRPTYAGDIADYVNNQNFTFVKAYETVAADADKDSNWIIEHGVTLGNLMLGTIKTLPSMLVGVAGFVASGLVCIQVMLEIIVRRIFAPVAIIDIYQEGLRSPGARYLKKYLATFFKLMIIAIIGLSIPSILGNVVSMAASDGAGGTMLFLLLTAAVSFSGIGMMFKGGEIANDVLGV